MARGANSHKKKMKRIFAALLLLLISSAANAEIRITVNGVINPPQKYLTPNQTASIGLWSKEPVNQGDYFLGIIKGGPGSFDIDDAVINYVGVPSEIYWFDEPDAADNILNVNNPFLGISLVDTVVPIDPLEDQLVDNILFRSNVTGTANLVLFDPDLNLIDSQTINIVPEPMSIAFLALGGLLLRRKNRK